MNYNISYDCYIWGNKVLYRLKVSHIKCLFVLYQNKPNIEKHSWTNCPETNKTRLYLSIIFLIKSFAVLVSV